VRALFVKTFGLQFSAGLVAAGGKTRALLRGGRGASEDVEDGAGGVAGGGQLRPSGCRFLHCSHELTLDWCSRHGSHPFRIHGQDRPSSARERRPSFSPTRDVPRATALLSEPCLQQGTGSLSGASMASASICTLNACTYTALQRIDATFA
jgi:hypothetical protein